MISVVSVVGMNDGVFPRTARPSSQAPKQLEIHIPSSENKIRNLSGGQRQSVAIARTIYWNAKILIMDEPTAALAVAEQAKVPDLARSLKDHGVGVIIISYQMRDVSAISDRIIVMHRGKKWQRN